MTNKPRAGRVPPPGAHARVLIAINSYAAYQRSMIEGVLRYTQTHSPPWRFVFRKGYETPEQTIEHRPPCDAILASLGGDAERGLQLLRKWKRPAVLIETNDPRFPRVIADNRAIGEMAFEHLRSKGFRRFACLGFPSPPIFRERCEAFAAAVKAAGQELVELRWIDASTDVEHDSPSRRWIARLPKPTALFTGNVFLAREVVVLCQAVKVLVPEELAVLGVDNEALSCEMSWPPISSVDHGMERSGYEAARLLHRLLDGQPAPPDPVLIAPLGVVERQSTDTLAVEDPDVRAAVQLIRQRVATGLSVKELFALLPVGRRKLEINFRRCLGRSIHAELLRLRVERAKFLLRSSEMAMDQVALGCGLEYASHLSAVFTEAVGMTPTDYRRQQRGS